MFAGSHGPAVTNKYTHVDTQKHNKHMQYEQMRGKPKWDAQICLTIVRASKLAVHPRCGMSNPTKVYSSQVLINHFPHFHEEIFFLL